MMQDKTRKERSKEKSRLRKAARKILIARYHTQPGMINGYPGICKYIRHYRPDLRADGYDLIRAFLGNDVPQKPIMQNFVKDGFYETREWREVRYRVLQKFAGHCQCCGRGAAQGVILHVDHIKPRSKFPELALTLENLQVLCEDCNLGKSNKDDTDWRPKLVVDNSQGRIRNNGSPRLDR